MDNQLERNRLSEVIKEGTYFKSIFEDDMFKNKIEEIQQRNYAEWLEAKELPQREMIFQKHQALIQLLVELKMPIMEMEQATQKLDQM